MKTKPTFADLIRNKEIQFYTYGRKLDIDISQYGKYNLKLMEHLVESAGNKIIMNGDGLESHLATAENLYPLAEFVVYLQYTGSKRYSDQAVHVHANINKLNEHYQKPEREELINLAGQVVGDASSWVPEMPYFEKLWNFALDSAVGGMVGYPGYEHPRNDLSFRIRVAELAERYMIGTKQQIQRYKKYAFEALQNTTSIAEELKNNPGVLFKDPSRLRVTENNSRSARILAENIVHFHKFFST